MAQVAVTETEFQRKLKHLLEKDDSDCKLLVDVYNEVKTYAENSSLVRENVLQFDPTFFERVRQGVTDLTEADRPILVIGETSAGKSSFLNLLIGRKVLPELTRPCTHCMCCIKKGTTLEARVSSFNSSKLSEPQIISGVGKSDKEFRAQLQELVNEDNCERTLDRCIEIFVPSSILEDKVYLVDTPGFGENERVTKSLVKYLPKAIGIIFILNATVSLGIADDRGVLILDEIKRLREEGKIPSFDPTKVLFIANKWDQVTIDEREVHRREMIEKMKAVWPNFQEDQLLPLSVTYVTRLQSRDCSNVPTDYDTATADYQSVLDKIRAIVEHCGNARSQVHKGFLLRVFKHMKTFVDATVTYTLLSAEEKKMKVENLQSLVTVMDSTYEKGKQAIDGLAGLVQRKLVDDVYDYLNNPANTNEIFPWSSSNRPKGKEYAAAKQKEYVAIRGFIADAIGKRIANSQQTIEHLTNRMSGFTLELKGIQEQIENLLKDTDEDVLGQRGSDEETQFRVYDSGLSKAAIATIVATSPLWIPLGIAGVVTVLPIGAAVDFAKRKYKLAKYNANPGEHLSRWSKKIIRAGYSKPTLNYIIFSRLTTQIEEEMNRIEKSISEFRFILQHLEKNMESDVVPEGYYDIRNLCRRMDENLTKTQLS
ncbi:bacterial dynamin-like protein [Argopecten irradians]|uniref:bacterial dynamin-like protein n=1 Tax=Argopecten irradians TaxID=31199 RepID=UPI00371A46A8